MDLQSGNDVLHSDQDLMDQEAGFNSLDEVPAQAETTQAEVEPEQQIDDPQEVEAQAAAEEVKEQIENAKDAVNDLQEQLGNKDLTQAEIRKVHGKIGEINARMLDLGKRLDNLTVSSPKLELKAEHFKEIAEGYDSELAENIAKGISRAFGIGGEEQQPQGQQVQQQINPDAVIADVTAKVTRQMNERLLRMNHPDYLEIAHSQEFAAYKVNLSPELINELANSEDAVFLSDELDKFKEWHTKQIQQKQSGDERLKNAVQPKGKSTVKRALMTEEDGFNSV